MTFLRSPMFFGWLLAAGLPLLVWWLYRHRRTVVEWSANYILRRTLRDTTQRSIWRQVVILSLRTLVAILIILAVARPFIRRAPAADELPHGDGALHQIVLIDNSASMSISYRAFTREAEMRNRLEALLARMRYGDHCEIIFLAPAPGEKLAAIQIPVPASRERLRAVLEGIAVRDEPAAMLDGLQLAAERFHVTRANNRHLVVLSDFTRKDIPAAAELRQLRREFQRLGVRLAGYEVRDRPRPNLALKRIRAGATTLFAGWRYHLFVEVHNYSRRDMNSGLDVQFMQAGRQVGGRGVALDLKAGEQKLLDLPLDVPKASGRMTVRVAVHDEAYQPDNSLELAVDVKDRARILLVRHAGEDQTTRELWRDSYYFQAALEALTKPRTVRAGPVASGASFVRDPRTGKIRQVNHPLPSTAAGPKPSLQLDIARLRHDQFAPDALETADAVVLFAVGELDAEVRDALQRFVERGGGLLLGLGETVYEDSFNESFAGVSPAPLRARYLGARRDRDAWDYDADHKRIEKTVEDPILRRYLSEDEGPIENVRVYNYFRVGPGGTPLMQLSNGDPLLLEHRLGRGSVMLYTSTLGGGWNTLAARNMYSNFVYAWLTRLCTYRQFDRNLMVSDPLILAATPSPLVVVAPDGTSSAPLTRKVVDGRAYFRYDGTDAPGDYRLNVGGKETDRLLVQRFSPESDAIALDNPERSALAANMGGTLCRAWGEMAAALATEELKGWSPAGLFILALMLCLLLDAALTKVWFR